MSLSYSTDRTDETGRELLTYGTPDFPISFFDDDLTIVRVPWHWHDEWEISVILSGTVRVSLVGRETVLRAGEGCFIGSGVLHSASLLTQTGHQHAMVFSPRVIAAKGDIVWGGYVLPVLTRKYPPVIKFTPEVEWQREVLALAEKAWLAGASEEADYPLAVRESLSRILSRMIRNIDPGTGQSATSQMQRDEQRIKKTLDYIETHFREQVTVEDIAGSAGISVSTLLRLYHDILHTTPIQYVLKYRLEQIRRELRTNPGSSIADAAYSCGFNDISYFNRCYLKAYGSTPSAYRRGWHEHWQSRR